MSIAKAVDKETAGHGDQIVYNISATNADKTNTCAGADLTITDDLTDIFVDATLVSTDATDQNGNVLTWVFTNVDCGATVTGEVVVEVSDQAFDGAIMENNAWVRDNNDNSVNSLKVATEIEAPLAVLSLVKSVDKALANPGDTLAYTVTVSNSGQSDATNVVLVDTLPAGFTFADSKGNNTGDTEATWTLGTLAIGADKTVTYDVLIDSHAGVDTYENLATVTAENYQAITAKAITDVAIPTVLGEETPSLTITKSVDQEYANPGNSVNYTVTVTNDGNAPALNAVLTDTLPVGFVFADTGETTATWPLGDIVPTESVSKTYAVKIDSSILAGKYINTAAVSADEVKPVSAQATLEIRELQVLGAETDEEAVLPVTGGGLAIVLAGLATLGAGIFLRKKIQ